MNKFKSIFSGLLFMLLAFNLFGQEPKLHPEQFGSYGAAANSILVAQGGTNETEFKTAATLGLLTAEVDGSVTNEAQTISAAGTTAPTISLNQVGGAGGGTVTLNGAGGISLGQSGGTITITQTAGATYTAGTGISISAGVISNTGDADNDAANEIQTLSYNSGTGGLTISGGNSVTLVDNSTTNEIQTLARTASTNTATLTLTGGSTTVDDLMIVEEFAPTTGSTVSVAATLPADAAKIIVERNGLVQNVGAGKGVTSISGATVTFGRAFASGEIVRVRFPKQ